MIVAASPWGASRVTGARARMQRAPHGVGCGDALRECSEGVSERDPCRARPSLRHQRWESEIQHRLTTGLVHKNPTKFPLVLLCDGQVALIPGLPKSA